MQGPFVILAERTATATIDTGRSTSLPLYKYDLTGAENDDVWDSQSYVSTGLADEQANTALDLTTNDAYRTDHDGKQIR